MYQKGRQQTREREQGASFLDTAAAHARLARDAMKKRNFTLAVKEFELALERDPNLAEARQGLLEAKKRLSEGQKAGSE
jgi:Tfp pilus assembly protein PilF